MSAAINFLRERNIHALDDATLTLMREHVVAMRQFLFTMLELLNDKPDEKQSLIARWTDDFHAYDWAITILNDELKRRRSK